MSIQALHVTGHLRSIGHIESSGPHVNWVVRTPEGTMEVELLFSGYYRGPQTFLDTYAFLRLYPHGLFVYAESYDPDFDFPGHIASLGLGKAGQLLPDVPEQLDDGRTYVSWGRFTRQQDVPALNWGGQCVGHLADALETTSWFRQPAEVPGQWIIVGPGRLRSTALDGDLVFVPDNPAELDAPADRPRD